MNKKQLHKKMSALYNSNKPLKEIIMRSVQLGMEYEYALIQEGINVVMNEAKIK